MRAVLLAMVVAILGGCASRPGFREVFPGVRVDAKAGVVEFDGIVPIDASTPTLLEVTVCTPGMRDHESLVAAAVKPSHVHAALLLAGNKPGTPGAWYVSPSGDLGSIAPTGEEVAVWFITRAGGRERKERAEDWIRHAETGRSLTEESKSGGRAAGFVFAGSEVRRFGRSNVYRADMDGTVVGLTTFGTETVAWRQVFTPEETIQELEWVADAERVPAFMTPVTVRIERVKR